MLDSLFVQIFRDASAVQYCLLYLGWSTSWGVFIWRITKLPCRYLIGYTDIQRTFVDQPEVRYEEVWQSSPHTRHWPFWKAPRRGRLPECGNVAYVKADG